MGCDLAKLKLLNIKFMKYVYPVVSKLLGASAIVPLEASGLHIGEQIDMLSCIDYFLVIDDSLVGLSSRITEVDRLTPRDSFWIRNRLLTPGGQVKDIKTEYQKLLKNINSNGKAPFPWYTCQTVFRDNELISGAIAETKQLINIINTIDPKETMTYPSSIGPVNILQFQDTGEDNRATFYTVKMDKCIVTSLIEF